MASCKRMSFRLYSLCRVSVVNYPQYHIDSKNKHIHKYIKLTTDRQIEYIIRLVISTFKNPERKYLIPF